MTRSTQRWRWSEPKEDETGQATAGFMWRDLGGAKSTTRSHRHIWGWGAISPACLIARSRRLSTLSLSLFLSLSLTLTLSTRLSSEMVWNENRNVKQFLGQSLYFTVKWNVFLENSIFHTQPNIRWGVKWFPKMLWSQNKRTPRFESDTTPCMHPPGDITQSLQLNFPMVI